MFYNIIYNILIIYSISILIIAEFLEPIDDNTLTGCNDDNDCSSWEICRNYQCYDGCIDSRCGYNARCLPENHTYTCKCFNELKGDPYIKCNRECFDDNYCNDHQLCKDNVCVYACDYLKCGKNALCTANNHIAYCQCKFCTEGEAAVKCEKMKNRYCRGYYYL